MLSAKEVAAIANPLVSEKSNKKLVVVHLSGGNDGLNTVIPLNNGAYYDARPTISVAQKDVLKLTSQTGLHPSMSQMRELFERGKLAIVEGTGYENHTRSHFRSIEIWQTAQPDKIGETDWLNNFKKANCENSENGESKEVSRKAEHIGFKRFLASNKSNKYPGGKLSEQLRNIASAISYGSNASIFSASIAGFDTHFNQGAAHAELLKQLSESLFAFQSDLEKNGNAEDVLTLVFSEFGRRLHENDDAGTDHGTAAPLFILGSQIKGGIYGESPSLTRLDDGDIKYSLDFRTIYATILERWLNTDSVQILGKQFEILPVV